MKMQRRGSGGQRGESLMGICEKVPRLTNKMTLIVEQHL
jgi:hypothetical protein